MSKCKIIDDKQPSDSILTKKTAGFPWVRFDAGRFIWEEAFFEGNYVNVHHSAMGRCQSRERIFNKITRPDIDYIKKYLPAFELEINGQYLRDRWRWESNCQKKTDQGYDEFVTILSYELLPVVVNIHTLLDGSEYLCRWLTIENTGPEPFAISKLFPWCGIISEDDQVNMNDAGKGIYIGRFNYPTWSMEGEFIWEDLPSGTFKFNVENRVYNPPMFFLRNDRTGELTTVNLEWSGNMQYEVTNSFGSMFTRNTFPLRGNFVHAKIGLAGPAPHRVVEPGETLCSPRVHFSMVYGDLDKSVNCLYEHVRESLKHKEPISRTCLVEYNHTGYTCNQQITKKLLFNEVDIAYEIGAELFMVDAGWFGAKELTWWTTVGDWYESPLLENGLSEVFNYIRSKGMKCGLWFELERAGIDSDLYKNHPEMLIERCGKKYEILDLAKPEVEEHLFNTVVDIINKYELDCFRLDYNYEQFSGGERINGTYIENTMWRYVEAVYRLFERLQERYPDLLLENCGGGGGRMDLGMMKRFHWTQITDNIHPANQIRILNGVTLGLPPELCMYIVGAISMHIADIDFSMRVGLFGHFCISGAFPQLNKANEEALDRWKHTVELYKNEIRPILPYCKVYRHFPLQDYSKMGEWVVMEYVSGDSEKAVVGIFRLQNSESKEYRFIPRGLDISKEYVVTSDNSGVIVNISGYELSTVGFPVRLPSVLTSELLIIKVK